MVRLQSVHQQKPEKKYPIVTGKLVSGKSRKQATADLFLHKCFHQISSLSQKTCGRFSASACFFLLPQHMAREYRRHSPKKGRRSIFCACLPQCLRLSVLLLCADDGIIGVGRDLVYCAVEHAEKDDGNSCDQHGKPYIPQIEKRQKLLHHRKRERRVDRCHDSPHPVCHQSPGSLLSSRL